MATNTQAFFTVNPDPANAQNAMVPERAPTFLWGQGTPDGDREPFLSAQKGTLYSQTDATDDQCHLWQKVDEGNDDADWEILATGLKRARSVWFNLDNGAGTTVDDVLMKPARAALIVAARILYVDATTGTVAGGNAKIGTTLGGAEVVAATAYEDSKAVGTSTAMTIVSGVVAAAGSVFVRHTGVATTQAGQSVVEIEYYGG